VFRRNWRTVRRGVDVYSVRSRLKDILRQYELRECHFECVIRSKELEVLLPRARAAEQKQPAEGERLEQRGLKRRHVTTCLVFHDPYLIYSSSLGHDCRGSGVGRRATWSPTRLDYRLIEWTLSLHRAPHTSLLCRQLLNGTLTAPYHPRFSFVPYTVAAHSFIRSCSPAAPSVRAFPRVRLR
jgi:hypothetical protein